MNEASQTLETFAFFSASGCRIQFFFVSGCRIPFSRVSGCRIQFIFVSGCRIPFSIHLHSIYFCLWVSNSIFNPFSFHLFVSSDSGVHFQSIFIHYHSIIIPFGNSIISLHQVSVHFVIPLFWQIHFSSTS